MNEISNLTGSKIFFGSFDPEEQEINDEIAYGVERWEKAIENAYPKRLKIVERRNIQTNYDIRDDLPETLTIFVPNVDRSIIVTLDELLVRQRIKAAQVISVLPPPARIPPVQLPPEGMQATLLYIPDASSKQTRITTRDRIQYHSLRSIRDYFEEIIEPLIQCA
jgi:hypothetical protein